MSRRRFHSPAALAAVLSAPLIKRSSAAKSMNGSKDGSAQFRKSRACAHRAGLLAQSTSKAPAAPMLIHAEMVSAVMHRCEPLEICRREAKISIPATHAHVNAANGKPATPTLKCASCVLTDNSDVSYPVRENMKNAALTAKAAAKTTVQSHMRTRADGTRHPMTSAMNEVITRR